MHAHCALIDSSIYGQIMLLGVKYGGLLRGTNDHFSPHA